MVSPVTSDWLKIQKSTRTITGRKCEKVRKGVEPTGFNKEVWKAQWAMKEMFLTGKLLKSGTVPKNPEKKSNTINSETTANGKTIFGLKLKSTESITKNQHLKSAIGGGGWGPMKIHILKKIWEDRALDVENSL